MPKKTRAERRLEFEALVRQYNYERACEIRAHQISLIRSQAAKKRHAEGRGFYQKEKDLSVVDVRKALAAYPGWSVSRVREKGVVGGHGGWTAKYGDTSVEARYGEQLVFALLPHGVDLRRAMNIYDPSEPYNLVGGQLPDVL